MSTVTVDSIHRFMFGALRLLSPPRYSTPLPPSPMIKIYYAQIWSELTPPSSSTLSVVHWNSLRHTGHSRASIPCITHPIHRSYHSSPPSTPHLISHPLLQLLSPSCSPRSLLNPTTARPILWPNFRTNARNEHQKVRDVEFVVFDSSGLNPINTFEVNNV